MVEPIIQRYTLASIVGIQLIIQFGRHINTRASKIQTQIYRSCQFAWFLMWQSPENPYETRIYPLNWLKKIVLCFLLISNHQTYLLQDNTVFTVNNISKQTKSASENGTNSVYKQKQTKKRSKSANKQKTNKFPKQRMTKISK